MTATQDFRYRMCRRAGDLAALGYVALATDMYGVGSLLTMEKAGGHFLELSKNPDLLRARVVAAFDHPSWAQATTFLAATLPGPPDS